LVSFDGAVIVVIPTGSASGGEAMVVTGQEQSQREKDEVSHGTVNTFAESGPEECGKVRAVIPERQLRQMDYA
jgi:hypothetical protein